MNNNIASKHGENRQLVGPKLVEGLPDEPERTKYVQPTRLRNLNLVPTLK